MAARPSKQTSRNAEQETPPRPPYYIAVEPLFIDGSQFARAHNPGDHVPADHVEKYSWRDLVRPPDGYDDDIADQPADDKDAGAPRNEPDTAERGQATPEGKDA
jgi:hypothetical protein